MSALIVVGFLCFILGKTYQNKERKLLLKKIKERDLRIKNLSMELSIVKGKYSFIIEKLTNKAAGRNDKNGKT